MPYQELASALQEFLKLEHPPVALALVDHKPDGVPPNTRSSPSTCSFWRRAENGVFFASASEHSGCAVGAHVMGFPLSPQLSQDLTGAVQLMATVGYLAESEVAGIPQVKKSGAGVVYGPLGLFALKADAVVIWLTPGQAMLMAETFETTAWKAPQPEVQALFGRPTCAALARSINSGAEAYSLGCIGMRTFTGISPALGLFVIPGSALATLADDLARMSDINAKMLDHYQGHLATFA